MLLSTICLLFILKPIYSETPAPGKIEGAPVMSTAATVETSTKEIDKKLFDKIKEIALQCAKETKINVDECLEMFNEYEDLRQQKYNQCKCWIPCVAKQLDLMKDDDYKLDSIRELISQLETKPWRNEASRIFELCTNEGGTGCEGGFNMLSCMMDHSEKAVETGKHLLAAVKEDMLH